MPCTITAVTRVGVDNTAGTTHTKTRTTPATDTSGWIPNRLLSVPVGGATTLKGKAGDSGSATRLLVAIALVAFSPGVASASPFTPLEWQQRVQQHANPVLVGQLKHTTWMRDQNRNFIDDEIERRFGPGQQVNVIVNLNHCLEAATVATLGQFGQFRYASRLVTFALINQVRFEDLPTLAALPEVAMIEWQAPLYYPTDVSTRAIQVRRSTTYSPDTAEDRPASFDEASIAILDSGVDDGVHEALPASKLAGGFDATRFEDANLNGIDDSCEPAPRGNGQCTDQDDEPAHGTSNPDDDVGHGTSVAHVALGVGTSGRTCNTPGTGDIATCAGVAPRAKLFDLKVSSAAGFFNEDKFEAFDWLGINRSRFGIRVANLSAAECLDDDGTSASAQIINYVVALGVVVVTAHGNAAACSLMTGTVVTQSHAAASYAIAVAGTSDDNRTVSRTDDGLWSGYLQGPRRDFNLAAPDIRALKPDLSAPAQDIVTADFNTAAGYSNGSGTSLAAPHVAGVAAIILGTRNLDPGSLKELLKQTADTSQNNAAYPMVDARWDSSFGSGMLNAWPALSASALDVGFPGCVGPPIEPGQPCELAPPQPYWLNEADIRTASAPRAGVPNTITAGVRNYGQIQASVLVDFGVYIFGVGNNQFFHIGTRRVTIPAGAVTSVSVPWTPADPSHQCIQVSIAFGPDSNAGNNVTQRNLEFAPSLYQVRVENPLSTPARMAITTTSTRPGWRCVADQTAFMLDPFTECPRRLRVRFDAPANARPGESADCHVAVSATPVGSTVAQPVGGVTVRTFVPGSCRVVGSIQTGNDAPVSGVRLRFARVDADGQPLPDRMATAVSANDGLFFATLRPGYRYAIQLARGKATPPVIVEAACGMGTLKLVTDREGLRMPDR